VWGSGLNSRRSAALAVAILSVPLLALLGAPRSQNRGSKNREGDNPCNHMGTHRDGGYGRNWACCRTIMAEADVDFGWNHST
jgi:hypothetical protein